MTRYAIERLLFRLSQMEATEHWMLKGAMLFVTWPEHVFRPTGDLDLLGQGDPNPAVIAELFTRICQVEVPNDGIRFNPASLKVEAVRETDKYQGVQLSLKGELAGASSACWSISASATTSIRRRNGKLSSLLLDLPRANILMYPPETVVAEKFEAIIRFGEANGRIKDFTTSGSRPAPSPSTCRAWSKRSVARSDAERRPSQPRCPWASPRLSE